VEHISKLDGALTTEQIEASGQLLAYFHDKLDVPLELIGAPGDRGVGVHVMFAGTWCGRKVFWQGSSRGIGQFGEILEVADNYAKWGLYQTGERNMP